MATSQGQREGQTAIVRALGEEETANMVGVSCQLRGVMLQRAEGRLVEQPGTSLGLYPVGVCLS